MPDPNQISFVPVEPQHYPLLQKWLAEPHMQEWWGDPDTELGYIRDMVEGRDTTRPFLIALDGAPIGPIVGEDAKRYGWDALHRAYAEKLGLEAKGWPEVFQTPEA